MGILTSGSERIYTYLREGLGPGVVCFFVSSLLDLSFLLSCLARVAINVHCPTPWSLALVKNRELLISWPYSIAEPASGCTNWNCYSNISRTSDPLVHHGRHFCRTVHALSNMNALLTNGILWAQDHSEEPAESFTAQYADPFNFNLELFTESYRERKEHEVYLALLRMVPGLEERLMTGDTETVMRSPICYSRKFHFSSTFPVSRIDFRFAAFILRLFRHFPTPFLTSPTFSDSSPIPSRRFPTHSHHFPHFWRETIALTAEMSKLS